MPTRIARASVVIILDELRIDLIGSWTFPMVFACTDNLFGFLEHAIEQRLGLGQFLQLKPRSDEWRERGGGDLPFCRSSDRADGMLCIFRNGRGQVVGLLV